MFLSLSMPDFNDGTFNSVIFNSVKPVIWESTKIRHNCSKYSTKWKEMWFLRVSMLRNFVSIVYIDKNCAVTLLEKNFEQNGEQVQSYMFGRKHARDPAPIHSCSKFSWQRFCFNDKIVPKVFVSCFLRT